MNNMTLIEKIVAMMDFLGKDTCDMNTTKPFGIKIDPNPRLHRFNKNTKKTRNMFTRWRAIRRKTR